ncbi:MAG: succinyl-diaminopimelate desuccinylase [Wenzhouxiangellaceae bacterium]|nr:succinyl-diaminopimelate desuccinylase [Wenzhouxiangellaceae bacterium]
MISPVAALADELIGRRSVTPDDAGCQALIAQRLVQAGMVVEAMPFGPVSNLFASHGQGSPHLLLLGHTDVVPPGPEDQWTSPPFVPTRRDGMLFGRGAADMKSAVAAFVVALERLLEGHAEHAGTISLLLTSDEEGPADDGVQRIVPVLESRGLLPDYVLVGEPSSAEQLGDVVRIGRRGSIQARLVIRGQQGHTAYACRAENPVHRAAPVLNALATLEFDDADEAFPATRLQISNIRAGTGAENVTPGEIEILFNIRHNPNSTAEQLETQLRDLIGRQMPGDWSLHCRISGAPFGPANGPLREAVLAAVDQVQGIEAQANTGGGTSDGRFFGPLGIETIELGPVNRSIHRIDEGIACADLERLPELYFAVIERILGTCR